MAFVGKYWSFLYCFTNLRKLFTTLEVRKGHFEYLLNIDLKGSAVSKADLKNSLNDFDP